jgi:predicted lipid-binding transport protein (Tim44 family)
MGEGFQFIDIILFAMVAAFIILRLRSVLGRRHDQGQTGHRDPFSVEPPKPGNDDTVIHLPDPAKREQEDGVDDSEPLSALDSGFAQIQIASPEFDRVEFVGGAGGAFEMILQAFAGGDRETLSSLLSDEVFGNFERAITAREEAKETLENTLVSIRSIEPIEAYMAETVSNVTLKIVSEQANVTRNAEGEVVDGDPNHISEITDIWTFARDTTSRDPNWELVATRSLD